MRKRISSSKGSGLGTLSFMPRAKEWLAEFGNYTLTFLSKGYGWLSTISTASTFIPNHVSRSILFPLSPALVFWSAYRTHTIRRAAFDEKHAQEMKNLKQEAAATEAKLIQQNVDTTDGLEQELEECKAQVQRLKVKPYDEQKLSTCRGRCLSMKCPVCGDDSMILSIGSRRGTERK